MVKSLSTLQITTANWTVSVAFVDSESAMEYAVTLCSLSDKLSHADLRVQLGALLYDKRVW